MDPWFAENVPEELGSDVGTTDLSPGPPPPHWAPALSQSVSWNGEQMGLKGFRNPYCFQSLLCPGASVPLIKCRF